MLRCLCVYVSVCMCLCVFEIHPCCFGVYFLASFSITLTSLSLSLSFFLSVWCACVSLCVHQCFNIFSVSEGRYLPHHRVVSICESLGVPTVTIIQNCVGVPFNEVPTLWLTQTHNTHTQ